VSTFGKDFVCFCGQNNIMKIPKTPPKHFLKIYLIVKMRYSGTSFHHWRRTCLSNDELSSFLSVYLFLRSSFSRSCFHRSYFSQLTFSHSIFFLLYLFPTSFFSPSFFLFIMHCSGNHFSVVLCFPAIWFGDLFLYIMHDYKHVI